MLVNRSPGDFKTVAKGEDLSVTHMVAGALPDATGRGNFARSDEEP